ncbi:MAG: tyrosine--tRNA ligase, partial [Nanoarchaeota archaeon]
FVYPFLQAYDSVAMKADVEIGGEDQYFNFVFTRELQRIYGQEPEVVMTLPLLLGTDGKDKMSKTYNNHIGIEDSPKIMFGKVMSIPDNLISMYFDLLTKVPLEEVTELAKGMLQHTLHARNVKASLARELVSQYHSPAEALVAEREFERVHKYRLAPENVEPGYLTARDSRDIGQLLVDLGLAASKTEAKRKVAQNGVRIDGAAISDPFYQVTPEEGMIVNVGKRNFKKITYEPRP